MDLMLDLETLDTKPGGVILSIGAVFFDRKTGLIPSNGIFHEETNMESQIVLHGTVSADTMDFWARTDPEWIEKVMGDEYQKGVQPIREALLKLNAWCSKHFLSSQEFHLEGVWSQGQDFDMGILAEMYRRVANNSGARDFGAGAMPWPFYLHRDTRTVYDITGFNPNSVQRTGRHHNALDDCLHQVKCLLQAIGPIQRPFNNLSPAEAERLAMLSEEAGEVVQAISKILRHGYQNFHPKRPYVPNRELLNNELADLSAVQLLMVGSLDIFRTSNEIEHIMKRKLKFTHHQELEK